MARAQNARRKVLALCFSSRRNFSQKF